ncbi:MAG: hypothetical protein ABIF80_05490, partial [Patescibacteria group bacterium]
IHLARRKRKESIIEISREISDIHNENIAVNSFDFIFSPIKMNSLLEYSKTYHPYPFRITMS